MTAPPLHEGRQPLADGWTIDLPFAMARRVEDGALVFWHSPRRVTLWLTLWDAAPDAAAERTAWVADRSPGAFDLVKEAEGGVLRAAYRLAEAAEDEREPAFYGFAAVAGRGQVHLAGYFDTAADLANVEAAWRSLRCG